MTRYDDRFHENRFETLAIGVAANATHDAGRTSDVIPPLHLSSTFEWGKGDDANEHDYSRESNPTRAALEEQLACLEGGEHELAFASGMAAISTTILSLVPPGGHLVSSDSLYSGTEKLLTEFVASHLGADVEFVDAHERRKRRHDSRFRHRLDRGRDADKPDDAAV